MTVPPEPVRHPQMRQLLVAALRALSDPEFQRRVWIDRQFDPIDRWHHSFDEVIHTIWDDLDFGDAPLSNVGYSVRNEPEAVAVARVATLIDELLDKHGKALSDAEYVRTDEWPALVESARLALSVLCEQ